MEKKKNRDNISSDEYWMSIVFMLAAKSSTGKMMIAVDSVSEKNQIVYSSREQELCNSSKFTHERSLEVDIIAHNSDLLNYTIYCNYTPDYVAVCNLFAVGVRRIIYFRTEDLSEDTQDLMASRIIAVTPFVGNLNWMRDYISGLGDFGIFT